MTSRAERRRHQKAARKRPTASDTATIRLENPVAENFPTYIIGNSIAWQVRAVCEMESVLSPEAFQALTDEFARHRPSAAYAESQPFHDAVEDFAREHYVVNQDSAKGQHVVICGAGPSLNDTAAEWCPRGDQVWGNRGATLRP